jgi:nucleotide-binding universal stress UspA family protein
MKKRILVAVSNREAHNVLACAVEASRELEADIVLVHVVDPLNCFIGADDFHCAPIVEAMFAHGGEVVACAARWLNMQGCDVETRLLQLPEHGVTVGRAIAAVANETHADLVILGDRKNNWWRWLSDSIALDVLDNTRALVRCASDPIVVASPTPPPKAHQAPASPTAGI